MIMTALDLESLCYTWSLCEGEQGVADHGQSLGALQGAPENQI